MTTYKKNGIEVSMPEIDRNALAAMECCAEFLARMIRKYGKEILAEMAAESPVQMDACIRR